MVSYSLYLFSTMWIFLNIVSLVDFSFSYTLKIPFYHFFDTKLIFLTGLFNCDTKTKLVYYELPMANVRLPEVGSNV